MRYIAILAFLVCAQAHAVGGARTCIGTGEFLFTFLQVDKNGATRQRNFKVGIREQDASVSIRYYHKGVRWKKLAKEFACFRAANMIVNLAAHNTAPWSHKQWTVERANRQANMISWRRKVACSWAKSGKIPDIKSRSDNKVYLLETRISGVGRHPASGYRKTYATKVSENKFLCGHPKRTK